MLANAAIESQAVTVLTCEMTCQTFGLFWSIKKTPAQLLYHPIVTYSADYFFGCAKSKAAHQKAGTKDHKTEI